MTQVAFYVVEGACADDQLVCKLSATAYRQGHEIHIHSPDPATVAHLDGLLWTYRDISFLPHAQAHDEHAKDTPIHIGYGTTTPRFSDVLINLAEQVPVFFSQFERVVELVGYQDPERLNSREHYRFYKERGYPVHTHNIRADAGTSYQNRS